jgi:hypothetical protein
MATKYTTYDVQIMDRATGKALLTAGGKAIVVTAGLTGKLTLYNPDSDFASLSNPITPTRGKLRFATAVSPVSSSVDIYGIAGNGSAFVMKGVQTGAPTEIWIDSIRRTQTLLVPFLGSDYTAAAENDTGLDFVAGMMIRSHIVTHVTVLQAAKTFDLGLLSSETGGDADGFIVGQSLATLGAIVTKASATVTIGALLKETATGAAAVIPVPYIVALATSLTITPSAATTTAACLFEIEYKLPATA